MFKRSVTAVAVAGAVLLGSAGAASAHECFVVNRSAKGAAGASHSGNWAQESLADLFAGAHNFFGGTPLTPTQVALAVDMAVEAGLPSTIAFFEKATIPAGAPEKTKGDLTGIDHFGEHIGLLKGIYDSFQPAVPQV